MEGQKTQYLFDNQEREEILIWQAFKTKKIVVEIEFDDLVFRDFVFRDYGSIL